LGVGIENKLGEEYISTREEYGIHSPRADELIVNTRFQLDS